MLYWYRFLNSVGSSWCLKDWNAHGYHLSVRITVSAHTWKVKPNSVWTFLLWEAGLKLDDDDDKVLNTASIAWEGNGCCVHPLSLYRSLATHWDLHERGSGGVCEGKCQLWRQV